MNYLLACLKRIYRNQDTYDMMIDILAKASEDNYGRYTSKIPMMHKYGHYDTALNDCGIVFGPIPFAFVILSESMSSEDNYGRYTSKIPMMHKYGHYDTALNDCGIVFGPIPFAFVILSESMSEIDVGNIVNIMVLYTLNHPGELSLDYNGSNK